MTLKDKKGFWVWGLGVIVPIRDKMDCIRTLVYSYYTTITGCGGGGGGSSESMVANMKNLVPFIDFRSHVKTNSNNSHPRKNNKHSL